ncbi:hypothetical protein [Micromonospora maritima]|uniref:hypothetical protein n=1 Tax=Micromonospora maritima TaxID=986711 RepID=UPI00378CFC2B
MPRLQRVHPDAVSLFPMGTPPRLARCAWCGGVMAGTGWFSSLVDGHPPCDVCSRQLLGTEADRFVAVDLELLAVRLASLPRGRQRLIAARQLLAAARLLLSEHGGTTDIDASEPVSLADA